MLRITRILTVLVAVAALAVGTLAPTGAVAATASQSTTSLSRTTVDAAQLGSVKASLSGFSAGNLVSDAVFTNKGSMTEAQIQSFFNGKVSKCQSGYTCLKDFKITSVNRAADAYCKGYTGAKNETAARIIYKVAQSCGINAQVLIVMLQKEQGLVTHTWPSQWRYDIALGQGCPDDAACDPGYVGFFHQIYGAARQMQMYMEGKYFTWYAPGKTWNLRYHPNVSCGTSPVRIANKATAALYYYTPYQPNAAALAAGYGEGNSCSSYGNRNFYNYFTDWFGSTQKVAATKPASTQTQGLVKVGTAVWLLSGSNRYHITAAAYPEYKAVLGAPKVVASGTLNAYTEGTRGSFYVKNASTGVVALLQGSQTHRFSSCELVGRWGGACGAALVVMTKELFAKFKAGAEMSSFARVSAGGRIHQISDKQLLPLYDAAVAKARNGGSTPYAAVMPAEAKSGYTVGSRVRFAPATFVKASNAPEVWLADENGELHHLPSWPQAAELGLPSKVATTVKPGELSAYTASTPLSSFVQCGGKTYYAASGKLSLFGGSVPAGFSAVSLDATTCAKLSLKGTAIKGSAVFVKFSGSSDVFHLIGGQYRAVASADQRTAINGGSTPTVLTVGSAYRKTVAVGAAMPKAATFVRASGTPEVYLVDGARLVHLPSWQMAAEYGLASSSTEVSAATLTGMTKDGALQPFATCGKSTYVAASGTLHAVSASRVGSNASTTLSEQVCAGRRTGTAADAPVFLTDGSRTAVAVGGGFLTLNDSASVTRAAAGAKVTTLTVSAAYLDRLAKAKVPGDGATTRASNESTVTLLNGKTRQRIPNWGVAADLGIQARYQINSPQAVANRPVGGKDLTIFVQCNAKNYIGSGGVLYQVAASALGGFAPTALSAATCNTLKFSNAAPITTLRVKSSAGEVYGVSGGKLVRVTADAKATAAAVLLDSRTIAGMPRG